MTIAAGDLKKIDVDLAKEPTKAFDQEYAIGDGSGNPPKSISSKIMFRTRVLLVQDDSGSPTATLDFTNHEQISTTIDQDTTVTISGIPSQSVNYAYIVKGANDIATIAGHHDLAYSQQTGLTRLIFRIVSTNGIVSVTQENNQSSGSLAIGDLSIDSGSITSLDYFDWTINNNTCTLEIRFDYQLVTGTSNYDITLSNFDIPIANDYAAFGIYETELLYEVRALLTANNIRVSVKPSPLSNITGTLVLNTSFKTT